MITLLFDWMNIQKATEETPPSIIIGEVLKKAKEREDLYEAILFVPCFQTSLPWQIVNSLALSFGLEVIVCPVLRSGSNGWKDTVDMKVHKWVINHLNPRSEPTTVVFVTGDSHYLLPAQEAKRKGKNVEFWFVECSAVSNLIRQEKFSAISISSYSPLAPKPNIFLDVLSKFICAEELTKEEEEKIYLLSQLLKSEIEEVGETLDEIIPRVATKLNLPPQTVREMMECLILSEVVSFYPATAWRITINHSSLIYHSIVAL